MEAAQRLPYCLVAGARGAWLPFVASPELEKRPWHRSRTSKAPPRRPYSRALATLQGEHLTAAAAPHTLQASP